MRATESTITSFRSRRTENSFGSIPQRWIRPASRRWTWWLFVYPRCANFTGRSRFSSSLPRAWAFRTTCRAYSFPNAFVSRRAWAVAAIRFQCALSPTRHVNRSTIRSKRSSRFVRRRPPWGPKNDLWVLPRRTSAPSRSGSWNCPPAMSPRTWLPSYARRAPASSHAFRSARRLCGSTMKLPPMRTIFGFPVTIASAAARASIVHSDSSNGRTSTRRPSISGMYSGMYPSYPPTRESRTRMRSPREHTEARSIIPARCPLIGFRVAWRALNTSRASRSPSASISSRYRVPRYEFSITYPCHSFPHGSVYRWPRSEPRIRRTCSLVTFSDGIRLIVRWSRQSSCFATRSRTSRIPAANGREAINMTASPWRGRCHGFAFIPLLRGTRNDGRSASENKINDRGPARPGSASRGASLVVQVEPVVLLGPGFPFLVVVVLEDRVEQRVHDLAELLDLRPEALELLGHIGLGDS